jgi:ABC-type multidrug transport system ATPase subunit
MNRDLASVKLDGVTKLFGAVRALHRIDLEVKSGEVVAIMGGNGAGKSTLLSILSLTMRPTRGKVLFDGKEVRFGDPTARRVIGLLSHQPLVYPDMTGRENLILFAGLYGLDGRREVEAVRERLGLGGFLDDRPTRVLSRGQLQRVALARALISAPSLLLLDEPAAGLDSSAIAHIEAVLGDHGKAGGIAVLVTHEPDLAAQVADRAVMIKNGQIVLDRTAPDSAAGWREIYVEAVEGGGT